MSHGRLELLAESVRERDQGEKVLNILIFILLPPTPMTVDSMINIIEMLVECFQQASQTRPV